MKLYDSVQVDCDLLQLDPQLIKKYLISHKWVCVHTYPDGSSTLWEKGSAHGRLIVDKELYSDYLRILCDLLITIAKKENVSLVTLIKDIDNSIPVSYVM